MPAAAESAWAYSVPAGAGAAADLLLLLLLTNYWRSHHVSQANLTFNGAEAEREKKNQAAMDT